MAIPNGEGNGRLTKPLTQVVSALQGTPMLLVLAVLNVLILGMVAYLIKATERDHGGGEDGNPEAA